MYLIILIFSRLLLIENVQYFRSAKNSFIFEEVLSLIRRFSRRVPVAMILELYRIACIASLATVVCDAVSDIIKTNAIIKTYTDGVS